MSEKLPELPPGKTPGTPLGTFVGPENTSGTPQPLPDFGGGASNPDAGPPPIGEPDWTPHTVPQPESWVRSGPHIPDPPAIDPTDPDLPSETDFHEAEELVAKARRIKHLTSRDTLDPAWREARSRIIHLKAALKDNQDAKSKLLVSEINKLLHPH